MNESVCVIDVGIGELPCIGAEILPLAVMVVVAVLLMILGVIAWLQARHRPSPGSRRRRRTRTGAR